MRFLIGIDIGTQGVKAALYATDGTCRAEAFRPSVLYRPAPGVVEEDPERQLGSTLEVIHACVGLAKVDGAQIAAIAIAGQMAGIIGVDRAGKAVTPYDSWLDTRCSPFVRRMQEAAGDEIIEKAGNPPSFNHGPKILWWKHERPREYERICAFVQPSGYVAMRLGGLDGSQSFIDRTYLHFSGFANSRKLAWDPDLCQLFDVDAGKLPRIVEPQEIVATLEAGMAASAGLPAGIPLAAGCGDTAASFLSCNATHEGICVDVAGTASVFAATTRDLIADTGRRILGCGHSVIAGLWHPYAYINGGGQNLEWFRSIVLQGRYTLDELNGWAAESAHDDAMPFFIPHFGGRNSPSWPELRGGWTGLGWHTTPGLLFRSMLEGVALEYGIYQQRLRELLPAFSMREIRITGGGEKSRVWNQIKADRLQSSVVSIARSGGAPMGAALVAGHGVGLFPDLAKAAEAWVQLGDVTHPNPLTAERGKKRLRDYTSLLESMNAWSESKTRPLSDNQPTL